MEGIKKKSPFTFACFQITYLKFVEYADKVVYIICTPFKYTLWNAPVNCQYCITQQCIIDCKVYRKLSIIIHRTLAGVESEAPFSKSSCEIYRVSSVVLELSVTVRLT